ncbi:MAG: prolyl oligopeptidase family serine peptidase [Muribaculaceae bacterium]|nr:prolyl oligopeptidase family serine peptidase [Muribaculaceae bacterium]
MKLNRLTFNALMAAALSTAAVTAVSCGGRQDADRQATSQDSTQHSGSGPQLGTPGGGPVIDKSGDAQLQEMIKTLVPKFEQLIYTDPTTGKTMKYNLFSPAGAESSKKYPMVLFMADASTPGNDYATPLTQGYGALVWATQEWQSQHPCYVLVPQFSGVAVNDDYKHTDEVDIVARMVSSIASDKNVDINRIYTTGQSMGGMISMYFNVAYPDLFAASIFVDSHWDTKTFDALARHKFVYFIAGDKGKAYADIKPLEEAAEKDAVQYTFASWSAKLPEARQSELAGVMLEKGAPINIFQFEPGTVLPADGKGSEHMYSFDYAYRIPSVREWLFKQSR